MSARIVNGEIVRDGSPTAVRRNVGGGGGGGVSTLESLRAEREARAGAGGGGQRGAPGAAPGAAAPAARAGGDGALGGIATAMGIAGKTVTLPAIPAAGLNHATPIPLVHCVIAGAVLAFLSTTMPPWRVLLIAALGAAGYVHALVTTPM